MNAAVTVFFASEMRAVSSVFRVSVKLFSGAAIVAEESQKPKAEHIKRR